MPDEISVDDLVDLWAAGAVELPQVAIQYAMMARELHATALSQEAAFRRSIGGPGRLFEAWTSLRNLMQNAIAVRSYDNLLKAGDALTKIAESYANTDDLNARELREYDIRIEGINRGVEIDPDTGDPDVKRPPAYVPDAPRSTDPHPDPTPEPNVV